MKKLIIFLTCLFAPLLMRAQLPIMDITMVYSGGQYEVRLKPDNGEYQGIFSSILFTVKWNAASGIIGEFTPSAEAISYGVIPTISGDITTVNGTSYAIFAGFGFQTISPNWVAGQEILMGTFSDEGQTNFQLVNDAWTAANNGNYYLSLNGVDRTGIIYSNVTTSVEKITSRDMSVTLYPNPNNGTLKLVMDLPKGGLLFIGVIDANGKVVKRKTLQASSGSSTYDLDISDLASGQYTIQTRMGDLVRSLSCTLER